MKFGICCAPGALGNERRLLDILVEAGADYLDWSMGSLMASDAEFEKLRALTADSPLKPEAFMAFLPPTQRVTGPDVKLGATLDYATEAMRRARALGGEIVVLGSAGARKVPAGWAMETARAQFIEFCRELGPRAAQIGIVIAIEPLNSSEDNFITGVTQGAEYIDAIGHPNVQLLADFYHMFEENEPVEHVAAAGARIRHTHLADLGRVAPGYATGGEADFIGFFGALRRAGYDGRCSFEGKTDDLARQAASIIATMRDRYEQSAA